MLTGKIEQFEQLSQFTSIKDFNNNIEQWMIDIKSDFTKKELILLKRLIRFSSKVFGISNISINSLLRAVEQHDKVKVSEATFHRMKRKAIKLTLLEVHTTKRINDSQSSNVWVFNSYNDIPIKQQKSSQTLSNQQSENVETTPLKTTNLIKTSNIKDINIRKENNESINHNNLQSTQQPNLQNVELDYTHVSSNINQSFIDTVRVYYPSAKAITSLYRRLTLAISKNAHKVLIHTHIDDFISTFKQVIFKFKQNKIRGDLFGYLYKSWENTASLLNMQQKATEGIYYDWLKE